MVGSGCPDLLVAIRGVWALFELKDGSKPPSKRALTDDEFKWHVASAAPVHIVNSITEALAHLALL
jgi:hypothetical protein